MPSLARCIMRLGFTVGFVLLVALCAGFGLGAVWLAVRLLGAKGVMLIPLVVLSAIGWFISGSAVKDTDE
jgi:hypothetical protein